jgi:AcrR family transcriptional regulator
LDRQQKYDDKLLLIVDRACSIFAEKGYHNASVRDVASATGVSPAGLYYYFQSKEELLHLILESGLSSLMDRIREDILEIQDPADRLRAIVRSHLAHFEKNGKEMRVLVHEWRALSGSFSEDIRRLMREYARVVTRTLQELSPDRTRGELRAATFGLFGMLTWVDQWYRPERDLPLDLLAGQFAGIFLDGIRSNPRTALAPGIAGSEDPARGWVEKNSTSSLLSGPGF